MRLQTRSLLLAATIASVACDQRSSGHDTTGRAAPSAPALAATCYQAPSSILGRTVPLDGHTTIAPGWLRFADSSVADSGTVQLIDADGATFQAAWRRTNGDSLLIHGRDDFMEITLRARARDESITGTGLVTSDADVQRNAAGQLEPLRREWAIAARVAPCADAPAARPRR